AHVGHRAALAPRRIERNPRASGSLVARRTRMPLRDLDYVIRKLHWMHGEGIWPNGLRYLWTDAFGLVLYVSLFRETGEERWLDQAKWLVGDVDRVLGRPPGYGLGAMDAFDGYVSYKLLSEDELAPEIAEMRAIIERQYETLHIDQDLGLGMMLWLAHFFPREDWAVVQRQLSVAALDKLWVDPPGYFGRASYARHVRIAFANYGVSIGLQAQDEWPERVEALNDYFERYRSGDEYDREAITWVMACCAHFPGAFVTEKTAAEAAPA